MESDNISQNIVKSSDSYSKSNLKYNEKLISLESVSLCLLV